MSPINPKLGFSIPPDLSFVPSEAPDPARAVFRARKQLEGIVYDTVALEGNPFTLPEVKTLLDGVTVGGRRLSDLNQVLNQIASWKSLLSQVSRKTFELSRRNAERLHHLVAREEALTWGQFRDGPVTLSGTDYRPPPHGGLTRIFAEGLDAVSAIEDLHVRAMSAFLFMARNQFFYDGNKRTGRLLMNGILMSEGCDAVCVPFARAQEFNESMLRFYESADAMEMLIFLGSCSLDEGLTYE